MSTARYRLVALHGFLGAPTDWDLLVPHFPDADLRALDLWRVIDGVASPDWTNVPAALAAAILAVADLVDPLPAFVLAYSFGARLALAAATRPAHPGAAVRGYCLVSCNPGLAADDLSAREARRAADDLWARRLLDAPEPDVWAAWDAQPVFAGGLPRVRGALPAPRSALARALRACSVARQPDFRAVLATDHPPMLWVSGARDTRFSALADEVAATARGVEFARCANAGHRVPWDNPRAFSRLVRHWIERRLDTP